METKTENKDESLTVIFYNSNPFTVSYKEKRKNNNFRLNRCPKLKVFHMQICPILPPFPSNRDVKFNKQDHDVIAVATVVITVVNW